MDLEELRKRNKDGSLDKIIATLQKTQKFKRPSFESDETEWKLTTDQEGNGTAIIRFLPGLEEEGVYFIETLSHGFRYNGRWFIEPCPKKIEQPCPVCEHRWEIINGYGGWDDTPEEIKKNVLGPRNAKKSYWANILVIEDPACPENEGKVFKFRFGVKILEKITDKLIPKFKEELPIIVSDVDDGANFKMVVKKVGGFPNYDSCFFESTSKLENAKEVLKLQHPLMEIVSEDKFSSYDVLEKKYYEIIGATKTVKTTVVPEETKQEQMKTQSESMSSIDDEEDSDDYFDKLASEIV